MNNIVSRETYNDLIAKYNAYEAWRAGRTCVKTSEIPAGLDITNEQRSQIELYEFVNNPPERYFAYVHHVDKNSNRVVQIVNWMGEVLGNACLGRVYKSPGFWRGSTRYPVLKFKAINGKTYYGTYFASAGSYCRLKLAKA